MTEKQRILIVDDNEEFCRSVADIIEIEGYEGTSATDGFKALELVKQNSFALVLMDIKMPVMDGVETFKKIKELVPGTPVIMVTAFAVEDLIREALREGSFGFVKKPVDFDELLDLIARAIAANGAMILVVDDNRDLCDSMKDMLDAEGYRVSVAYGGNEAVEQAEKKNFDIILIDLKMPHLNGLEAYLTIREFRPNVVAVVITGYRQEMSDIVQQVLQSSAYTCLEKPIDMDNLVLLLEKIREQKDKGTLKKPG